MSVELRFLFDNLHSATVAFVPVKYRHDFAGSQTIEYGDHRTPDSELDSHRGRYDRLGDLANQFHLI